MFTRIRTKFPEEYRPKIGIAFSAIANTSKHNARFVVRPSGEVAKRPSIFSIAPEIPSWISCKFNNGQHRRKQIFVRGGVSGDSRISADTVRFSGWTFWASDSEHRVAS